jgi:single-stranded DNA-specific DHH superfamily exonuclease
MPGSHVPRTDYDADVAVEELDSDFFTTLASLGPFGNGNPEPLLHLTAVSFAARPQLFGRDGNHVRGALTSRSGGMRELLAWKAKDRLGSLVTSGAKFDLLVRPEISRWRGEAQHRLVFVDGRSS